MVPAETHTGRPEIASMVDTLVGVLWQEHRAVNQVAALTRRRLLAARRGDLTAFQHAIEVEAEALRGFVLVERERVAALTEIGLTLGHRDPSRLRLAELVLHVGPEQRDELLDVREELRDVADEIDYLHAQGAFFEHHTLGRVELYLAPGLSEEKSRRWLQEQLMDRRGGRDADRRESSVGPGDVLAAEDLLSEDLLSEDL